MHGTHIDARIVNITHIPYPSTSIQSKQYPIIPPTTHTYIRVKISNESIFRLAATPSLIELTVTVMI